MKAAVFHEFGGPAVRPASSNGEESMLATANQLYNAAPARDRLMAETIDKYRATPSDYAHYEGEEI